MNLLRLLTVSVFVLALAAPVAAAEGKAAPLSAGDKALLDQAAANVEKYRKGDIEMVFRDSHDNPLSGTEVEVEQTGHEFLFGCIIFDLVPEEGQPYRPELFKQRFRELFNFAVFPFYWSGYEPQQGMPRWERMQETLEWCRTNGITAKGHPLVWSCDYGRPDWLAQYPPQMIEQFLQARVQNIVGGFRDRIKIWDVVNEPVNVRVWGNPDRREWFPEPLDSVVDYVDKAYRWAAAANPEAHLILNEYYTITQDSTRQRFFDLVKMLQARGTPIRGLGIQSHEPREEWYPPQRVRATFDRLAELGLPLHVTEFIPQSGGKPITGGWRSGTWDEAAQADFAEQFYRLAFGHPAVVSINWWGLSDRDIWQPGGGLVDSEYNPKPVYERLRKLIHEEWHTALTAKTDSRGRLAFRGFFGNYRLKLHLADGRVVVREVQARHDEQNHWEFRLD
ncbi:endo-1,4-beta-xylanase [bacterium]|nr:endo-1,4-beta-xylanase [bacterium]